MNLQTALSSQAEDLQRGYAAHTFSLRGFLPDGTRPTPPKDLYFTLSDYKPSGGGKVDVVGEFPSAPLFAYLKTNTGKDVSLEIRTYRNNSDLVQLTLIMPKQTVSGTVRLVWPDHVASVAKQISVKGDSAIRRFEVSNEHFECGERICISFVKHPLEVVLGAKEIPFTYEPGELIIVLPEDAVSGHLTIVTAEREIFYSSTPVQIKLNKNLPLASTAPPNTQSK